MKKGVILLALSIILATLWGCGGKNMLQDPGAVGNNKPNYMVNQEAITMPVLFNLPTVNPLIELNFTKPAAKPVKVSLHSSVDGWKAPNGKLLSEGGKNFGLVLDFSTGAVYEMPKGDLDKVLSNFTSEGASLIKATLPIKDGGNITKMAVIDAYGNFNRQELKYMNMLSAVPVNNMISNNLLTQEKPSNGGDLLNKAASPSNDSVVPGRPIISAAAGDQYDRLVKLLNAGGNIQEEDPKTGNNALISSVRYGLDNISNFLIDRGVNVNHANFDGQNALHVAASDGYYDISKTLIDKGINVNAKDNSGNTPLIYAAASPNPNLAGLMLDNGARMEDRNKAGETALAVAAFAGNTKTIDNLVKRGADTKTKDNDGNNLLMKSVDGGNRITTGMLLDMGVSQNEANNAGTRPIHAAIKKGYGEITSDLLKRGAEVNAKDGDGNTPLILASAGGNADIVNDILGYQPDITLKNNVGQNAYDMAMSKGFDGIRRTVGDLMTGGDAMTEILFAKASEGDIAGVEDAISKGARINSMDVATGNNVLFVAVANGYKKLTSFLLSKGADVNHTNARGNTPLIVAVTSSDKEMADMLIKAKAGVNARNNTGDTALIWAVKLKKIDIVKTLLLGGADPNIKNIDGVSPYLIADNEGTPEILKVLQAAGAHK